MRSMVRRWPWILLTFIMVTSRVAAASALGRHASSGRSQPLHIPFELSTAQIIHGLGPWLAEHSHIPVYLPSPFFERHPSRLDVGYAVLPHAQGFHVAFLFPEAAHSKREALQLPAAGAGYLGAIWIAKNAGPIRPIQVRTPYAKSPGGKTIGR